MERAKDALYRHRLVGYTPCSRDPFIRKGLFRPHAGALVDPALRFGVWQTPSACAGWPVARSKQDRLP